MYYLFNTYASQLGIRIRYCRREREKSIIFVHYTFTDKPPIILLRCDVLLIFYNVTINNMSHTATRWTNSKNF